MTEQTVDVGRGISLAYEEFGDGEPLVLVAGLGQQLHSWPTPFCTQLAERGYRVVRFDNRDVGRSTHLRFRPAKPLASLLGRLPAEQYELADMAEDTVGLLDALGHDSAHLVGVSMGGMIAQTVAAHHPDRVRTLTSIMSTTGARRIGRPALSTMRLLAARPARTRDDAVARALRMFRHIGSHGYPIRRGDGAGERGHRAGTATRPPPASDASSARSCAPATGRRDCVPSPPRRW